MTPYRERHRARRERFRERMRHGKKLRKVLFWSFGTAIFATMCAMGLTYKFLGSKQWSIVPIVFILWGLAGFWGRKLARPLEELTRVARAFGDGKLDVRARMRGTIGEIGELSQAMNDMADRLAAKARAEKELLAGVSHELRTPLQRAALLVELGRGGATGTRDVWAELDRELGEMNELVGQLLASARVDGKAMSMRVLDAGALARQSTRGGLDVVCPTPPPPLSGDATLLARALAALVDNARRHAGGATRLLVEGTPEGGVRFVVEDAGPGFTADDLPRVFEPFYRGNGEAHDEQRGVGLGLSLVRRIAEAHGGRAFAMNGPGGGARVGFEVAAPSA